EKLAISDDVGIERHLHHLGMSGRAGADLLVGRIHRSPARVAGLDAHNAAQPVENGFQTPEAPSGKGGDFGRICLVGAHRRVPWSRVTTALFYGLQVVPSR